MKKKIKEYLTLEIEYDGDDTQNMLDRYAKTGWRLICSYARNGAWLIMERDIEIEVCKCCGGRNEKEKD